MALIFYNVALSDLFILHLFNSNQIHFYVENISLFAHLHRILNHVPAFDESFWLNDVTVSHRNDVFQRLGLFLSVKAHQQAFATDLITQKNICHKCILSVFSIISSSALVCMLLSPPPPPPPPRFMGLYWLCWLVSCHLLLSDDCVHNKTDC